ncbi:hypothetical protein pb186bvf_014440 [Paramecium bursaria]
MGFFNLQFESQELEEKYQEQQQKYIKKSASQLIYILMIGELIAMIDNIFRLQLIMLLLGVLLVTTNIVMIYLIQKKKINVRLIILFFNTNCIMSIIVQIVYIQFQSYFEFSSQQLLVQLDVIHQFITLLNFGQSHLTSSTIYVLFIISRIYIQISYGFTSLSIGFALFCTFYIKDQYYNARQRRKQFLKGQRNKLLEQLIQEFIDEKVCIIEKDENNVKFIPVIINEKLQAFSSDINHTLKELQVCNNRKSLVKYLYITDKEKETLLCRFKQQIFQITYQRFILKTCQIFIKIKQVNNPQTSVINYKDLYHKQQNQIQKVLQNCQYAKSVLNKIQLNLFVYWFKKYYLYYRMKTEFINIQQIKKIMKSSQFDLISNDLVTSGINSDKLLIYLLFQYLKKCVQERQIKLNQIKSGILISVYGTNFMPINTDAIDLINKILFHIGIGDSAIFQSQNTLGLITIKLLDIKHKKFK